MGDKKSIALLEPQLHSEQLKPLEFITRDVLLVLSPTSVYQRDGSLFLSSWTQEDDLVLNGLFMSNHPAFLSNTLQFVGAQDDQANNMIWKNLIADRTHCDNAGGGNLFSEQTSGRLGTNQFYKSRSAATTVPNPDLDAYMKHVSSHMPEVGEFIRLFCGPPPPPMSITSQDTELTESSGVSSFEPKALKRRMLKQKENGVADGRRSSPRVIVDNVLKRRSDNTLQSTSKRPVLTELN